MDNQMIGISGVFALTVFLLVLRQWFLSLGRANRSRYMNPTAPRRDHESNTKTPDDDSWLLWGSELDAQAGPPKPRFGEHRGNRAF